MKPIKYGLAKKHFEIHLNDTVTIDYESDQWIIGGKRRHMLAQRNLFGTATRRYDPIGFEVAYQEWLRQHQI